MNEPTPWMTTEEAAAYARMSPEVLARLARLRKIKAGNDGRKYKWRREHIDAYLLGRRS
jgi:excisionase family DNA binding protein